MTSITQTGNGLPDNLPMLTEVADKPSDDLPTLTEVVAEGRIASAANQNSHVPEEIAAFPTASEEEIRLLRQLETRIEEIFAHRLRLDLEQLQREAIEQAVAELRVELPRLLRNAPGIPDSHR